MKSNPTEQTFPINGHPQPAIHLNSYNLLISKHSADPSYYTSFHLVPFSYIAHVLKSIAVKRHSRYPGNLSERQAHLPAPSQCYKQDFIEPSLWIRQSLRSKHANVVFHSERRNELKVFENKLLRNMYT